MASICLLQQKNSFHFAFPSYYGMQPSRTSPLETGSCSDDREMSDVDFDSDLPSIHEILARAKTRQPQAWSQVSDRPHMSK
jgi:hypothetical protein